MEVLGGFSAIDAVLATGVARKTALTISLVSTLGVDVGGRADGTWVAGTVGVISEKAGKADMTGDAWSHDCRDDCSSDLDRDVMSVGMGRLRGS